MNQTIRRTLGASALAFALAGAGSVAAAQATPPPASRPAPAAGAAQPQAPVTPEQVFAAWDKDKNNSLTAEEFKAGWQNLREAAAVGRLHAQFQSMDTNANDKLEAGEYANLPMIKRQGAKAPLMSAFDGNKDNSLDFREYVGMIETMIKNARAAQPAK